MGSELVRATRPFSIDSSETWQSKSPGKNGYVIPTFFFLFPTHLFHPYIIVLDFQPQLLVTGGSPRGPKRRRTTTAGTSLYCSSSSSLAAGSGSTISLNQQISSNDRPAQRTNLGDSNNKIPRYAQQTISHSLKTTQISGRTMNTNPSGKTSSKRSITQVTGVLDLAPNIAETCVPERSSSSFTTSSTSCSTLTTKSTTATANGDDTSIANNTPQSAVRFSFKSSDIIHDHNNYMFKLKLDSKGSIAALCYLPTRVQNVVEIYHTEVPLDYRNIGLGDLLVKRALQWAKQSRLLIIPTCPFVQRYLRRHQENESCIVRTEQKVVERLVAPRP